MKRMRRLADGVEYNPETDAVLLMRCPECGSENYAPMVATGKCVWRGYDAHELLEDEQ